MLLIGYGNGGRGDDGLGPEFASRIEKMRLPGIEVDIDYQLTVDHALMISDADRVVFVDAQMDAEEAFHFDEIRGAAGTLASHSLTPATVLALTRTLYGNEPQAFVLGIAGKEYGEVKEGLSDTARRNLGRAEAFFLDWLSANPPAVERSATPANVSAS